MSAAIAAGKSLEQIQQTLLLEPYEDWEGYATDRVQNIAGMCAHLRAEPAVSSPAR